MPGYLGALIRVSGCCVDPISGRFCCKLFACCNADNLFRDQSRRAVKAIHIGKSQYLTKRTGQDHRRITRRVRTMLDFKAFCSATVTLAGIEMAHIKRKCHAGFADNPAPSLTE